jgi:xanthine dehydrogenase accessory factor
MLVYGNGEILGSVGGGTFEAKVISEALNAIRTSEPKTYKFKFDKNEKDRSDNQPICGGKMEVLIEPIAPKPTLYIMGAGHIGLALAIIGKIIGFRIVVVDDRETFANKARFPDADEVLVLNFDRIADKVKLNSSSYVVIVTRGHLHDKTVLKAFIRSDATYIGMIGSRKKVKYVFQSLIEEGIEEKLIDRVYSPIGIDIGAQTASEIAVSIMAEMIAHARGKVDTVKTLSREMKK